MATKTCVVLTTFDGIPLKDESGADLTFRNVVVTALSQGYKGEDTLGIDEKCRRFELGVKIANTPRVEGTVELDTKDMEIIKNVVNKAYLSPLICGQIALILQGKELRSEISFLPPAEQ
jgi:hypothetical protein